MIQIGPYRLNPEKARRSKPAGSPAIIPPVQEDKVTVGTPDRSVQPTDGTSGAAFGHGSGDQFKNADNKLTQNKTADVTLQFNAQPVYGRNVVRTPTKQQLLTRIDTRDEQVKELAEKKENKLPDAGGAAGITTTTTPGAVPSTTVPGWAGSNTGTETPKVRHPAKPIKKFAQSPTPAMGIPDFSDYGEVTKELSPGQLVDYFLQKHTTARNPRVPHYDLRLGTPETGLYSWAIPGAKLPQPGGKKLAPQTQVHAYEYGPFSGTIGKGYGKGIVELSDRGQAVVTRVTPNTVSFTLAHSRRPVRYSLIRIKGPESKDWLLLGKPTGKANVPGVGDKTRMRLVTADTLEDAMDKAKEVQEKIDGAQMVVDIDEEGKPEVYSVRMSVSGEPIVHTERMGLYGMQLPKLRGTTFRAEAYGMRGEEAIPFNELSGLLNSNLAEAIKRQKERGIQLKLAPFEVLRYQGRPLSQKEGSFSDKTAAGNFTERELLERIAKEFPSERVQLPSYATAPEEKRQLLADIEAGKNPRTKEGVIIVMPDGRRLKYKLRPEITVYLRGMYRGTGKRKGTAGGLLASLKATGEPNLRVGTGFSDEDLADILANLKDYVGRPMRVEHQGLFEPTGLLRAPSFKGFETDKDPENVGRPVILDELSYQQGRRMKAAAEREDAGKSKDEAWDEVNPKYVGQPWNPIAPQTDTAPKQAGALDVTLSTQAYPPQGATTNVLAGLRDAWKKQHWALAPVFGPKIDAGYDAFAKYYGAITPEDRKQLDAATLKVYRANAGKRTNVEDAVWNAADIAGQKALPDAAFNHLIDWNPNPDAAIKAYKTQGTSRAPVIRKGFTTKVPPRQATTTAPQLTIKDGTIRWKTASAHGHIWDEAGKVDPKPTPAQKREGNYRKGHIFWKGLAVSIETPKNAVRSGKDADGKPWSIRMTAHYGYIRRTFSDADSQHVDVFFGPNPDSNIVYVVDQLKKDGKTFDEHKCMLGYDSAEDAKKGYMSNYADGWPGFGGITALTINQFKWWIFRGDTGRPIANQKVRARALHSKALADKAAQANESMLPEMIGAGGASALPLTALLRDYAGYRNLRKQVEQLKGRGAFTSVRQGTKRTLAGDLGFTGGKYDPGIRALQRGAEIASASPLGHGFVVGPYGETYHGGSDLGTILDIPKRLRRRLIKRLPRATARDWLDAVADVRALREQHPRILLRYAHARALREIRLQRAAQDYYRKQRIFGKKVIPYLDENPLRGEPGKMMMIFRPKRNITRREVGILEKQLRREAPAVYTIAGAGQSALRRLLWPGAPAFTKGIQRACVLDPSGRHHCGSLPGKIMQALGRAKRNQNPLNFLPADIARNPHYKLEYVAGPNPARLRGRLLRHMRKSMRGRGYAGLLAALGMGMGGAALGRGAEAAVNRIQDNVA